MSAAEKIPVLDSNAPKTKEKIASDNTLDQNGRLVYLLQQPHIIFDGKNRIISCSEFAEMKEMEATPLKNKLGNFCANVRCSPGLSKAYKELFAELEDPFHAVRQLIENEQNEILNRDIEALLYKASSEVYDLGEMLHQCCLLIRSHVGANNCSVFGLPDGNSLTGMMAVTPFGIKKRSDEWNYSSMNIATMAIKTKTPYRCDNTEIDKNYKKHDKNSSVKNLLCFPILNNGESIGVINVGGKLRGAFTEEDAFKIQKFANIISHLLREQFEKERWEAESRNSENLGKYLSKSVVQKISSTGTSGDLGGIMKKVVCLFSDIRSFTSISEGLSPADLVTLLNFYFNEMTAVIEKHHGTVDKLVGDLIMVLWNVPHDQQDPEALAIRCAIEMQKVAEKVVVPKWQEYGVPKFGIGIGINSGPAVVGNLGSTHFMNYTVIGSTINTAQRLEAKALPGEIWVHESILPAVRGKVPQHVRTEKNIKMKGIKNGVTAYIYKAKQVSDF